MAVGAGRSPKIVDVAEKREDAADTTDEAEAAMPSDVGADPKGRAEDADSMLPGELYDRVPLDGLIR